MFTDMKQITLPLSGMKLPPCFHVHRSVGRGFTGHSGDVVSAPRRLEPQLERLEDSDSPWNVDWTRPRGPSYGWILRGTT